jgi:hypothetical protein
MAYVRAIVASAGFNFSKPELDRNSDDMHIEHLDVGDDFSPDYGRLIVQVKCTYAHTVAKDGSIHFPLPIKNYNQLRRDKIEPRILIVVLVPRPDSQPPEPWIELTANHTIFRYRAYWLSLMGEDPVDNEDNVTVRVPSRNEFNIETVVFLMDQIAKGNKYL